MGLIKDLAECWRAEWDKRRKQEEKYRIEYAFTSGGTMYYRYADIANLPYERGLSALMVYNELEMRCTRTFLKAYADAVDKCLTSQKIDIYKIKALNDILQQRLQMPTDVDLMYKLASVVYFDKSENPKVYDAQYAEKKIAKWRKDSKVADFFTQTPLLELMPYLQKQDIDLDIYSQVGAKINATHSKIVHTVGSSKS